MTHPTADELPLSRLGFRVWLAAKAEEGSTAARAVQLSLRGSRIQSVRGLRRHFAGTAQAGMLEALVAQWESEEAAARQL